MTVGNMMKKKLETIHEMASVQQTAKEMNEDEAQRCLGPSVVLVDTQVDIWPMFFYQYLDTRHDLSECVMYTMVLMDQGASDKWKRSQMPQESELRNISVGCQMI